MLAVEIHRAAAIAVEAHAMAAFSEQNDLLVNTAVAASHFATDHIVFAGDLANHSFAHIAKAAGKGGGVELECETFKGKLHDMRNGVGPYTIIVDRAACLPVAS
ncbi:hypothetical protein [Massilia forsythiae]|uniref:hypothetical protein n=1 Tax=Massilia forsythiae TaxID=2728020 RepID=UPI001E52F334|nr:hypothetical protein [Massilia forsythiae]